jgi:tetratricopeptide (TPR) repeat protein
VRRLAALEPRLDDEDFAVQLGVALSDLGHQLDDPDVLALAEGWLGQLAGRHDDAIHPLNHGIVLARLGRHAEAIACFDQGLARDASYHRVHLEIAGSAKQLPDLDRAAAAYRAYLAAEPDDAHEWISLAIVECDAERYPEADRAYWRAAGLEPGNLSLHYNWFITAQRSGDRERAVYALRRMREIDAAAWPTRLAEADLLEETDPAGAFRTAEAAFADLTPDDDERHVAARVLAIASRHGLGAEGTRFAGALCARWLFSQEILDHLRELDGAARPLDDFQVTVNARYPAREVAGMLRHRVFAGSAEEAAAAAEAFERRCGADRVKVEEVSPGAEPTGAQRPGVWWRSGVVMYPIEQFDVG